jgi:membrane protease YdiL (CAAX protease family)
MSALYVLEQTPGVLRSLLSAAAVVPLAVIAAPVFEEFIFRGLIFGGLRRSFGVWPFRTI